MKQIRIAFVASTLGLGGAEHVISAVIHRLPEERFQSGVFLLREAGVVGRELARDGVNVVESIEHRRFAPMTLARLVRHFRRWRPDVVFCLDHHNAVLCGHAAAVAVGTKARVIGSHSTGLFAGRGSFRWSDHLVMDFTDCVVALSQSHADYLVRREGIAAGKIRVIANGVDTRSGNGAGGVDVRSEFGIGADERIVTMVAALRPEKAHEALLEAAKRLHGDARRLRILVVGDGPRRGAIEAAVEEMGLGGTVVITGPRSDVPRLLQASDILVLPSHDVVETLPLAVLEAMAAGVPVVASRVGSLPEVISDGDNGILIPPADGAALAAAIGRLLDDRPRALEMAARARTMVEEHYSVERMADGYAELFHDLATRN